MECHCCGGTFEFIIPDTADTSIKYSTGVCLPTDTSLFLKTQKVICKWFAASPHTVKKKLTTF